MMDKSYRQKNPDCNSKRYINSGSVSEIQASITFMKNNKEEITTEEQDIDKLGKFCSERKACRKIWLAALCLSGIPMCITAWYICSNYSSKG